MTKKQFQQLANFAGEKKVTFRDFECTVQSIDTLFFELDLILPISKLILYGVNYKKCKV